MIKALACEIKISGPQLTPTNCDLDQALSVQLFTLLQSHNEASVRGLNIKQNARQCFVCLHAFVHVVSNFFACYKNIFCCKKDTIYSSENYQLDVMQINS